MFTSFQNIFVTAPRQTENADARMNLRHHDPEYQRREKKKKDKNPFNPFDVSGVATVSIEALELFLEKFIKEGERHLGEQKTLTGQAFEKSFKDGAGAPKTRKSGQAAKAAGAYQHSAEVNVKGNLLDRADSADNNAPIPTFDMDHKTLRLTRQLLDDIRELRRRDIEFLTVEKAADFLGNLQNAVAKALA